jgi:tRNA(fMet)-specific endonuclease VapC
MARSMLDTKICICLMKSQPEEAARRFAQCSVGDVVMSADPQCEGANLIAAHAVALGVTIVTNHLRDLAKYPGAVVENWSSRMC